jgi:hypothetical protein
MLAASLLALTNISSVGDGTADINDDVVPTVDLLGLAKSDSLALRKEQFKHVLTGDDPAEIKDIEGDHSTYPVQLLGYFDQLSKLAESGEERKRVETSRQQLQTFIDEADKFRAVSNAGARLAPARSCSTPAPSSTARSRMASTRGARPRRRRPRTSAPTPSRPSRPPAR